MHIEHIRFENFCGFPEKYEVKLDPFAVLVGPNNGGKTTILRAIKFATDAFRIFFGEKESPDLGRQSKQWTLALSGPGNRLGVRDLRHFYYGRDQNKPATAYLTFNLDVDKVTLVVSCLAHQNNATLSLRRGEEIVSNTADTTQPIIRALYSAQTELIPPLGTLSPTEAVLTWPDLQNQLAQGKYAETWRNQLHWLNDGQPPELFQRVANVIRDMLGRIDIHPPRRTKEDSPSHVIVDYEEDGVEYDVSVGGGGLRTLVSLAAALELSKAPVLLYDEPDAHLHSSLQRLVARMLVEYGRGRQIIVATHAPDFVDEVPIDALRWIDRKLPKGERCDDVGRTLIRLGAASHSQAIQTIGADTILYFEAKPDRAVLLSVLTCCGKADLAGRIRPALLHGFGRIKDLPGALHIIQSLLPMRIALAAIRDADYLELEPKGGVEEEKGCLILRIPCKELENLLLMQPTAISAAVERAAEARRRATRQDIKCPSLSEIEQRVRELTQANDVREAIRDQWVFLWLQANGGLTDPGRLSKAETAFEEHWTNEDWRAKCCPGKMVLIKLKQWLQATYQLSITVPHFFAAYEPSQELIALFDKLDKYVVQVTGRPDAPSRSSSAGHTSAAV